jgi:archaellum component FlaC
MTPYSEMTDEELLEDVTAHAGNSTSLALECGVIELAKRFRAKCEEVETINTALKAMDRVHNVDLLESASLRSELAAKCEEVERLEKEVKDSVGLADILQEQMTPDFTPVDTTKLGQNAFFIRGVIKGIQRDRDNYEALFTSLRSELAKVRGTLSNMTKVVVNGADYSIDLIAELTRLRQDLKTNANLLMHTMAVLAPYGGETGIENESLEATMERIVNECTSLRSQLSDAQRTAFLAGVHYADAVPRDQDGEGEDAAADKYIVSLATKTGEIK